MLVEKKIYIFNIQCNKLLKLFLVRFSSVDSSFQTNAYALYIHKRSKVGVKKKHVI